MYPYQPKPWHLLTVTVPLFFIGILSLYFGDDTTVKADPWEIFGWSTIIIGWISAAHIFLASIWNNINEHMITKRNLIDTARHLDLDRMAAIGLIADEPKQTISTRVAYEDRHGNMERERISDLPISPVKMQVIANHVLEGAPFTRREWVDVRKQLSDGDFRKLFDAFKTNGIIAPKDPNKLTMGYEFTSAGRAFLRSASSSTPSFPSPTPSMDMVKNDA